ncbi:MAG: hypothetical protein RMJ51_00505 [Candidatus Calescibacterium sp.]|nr:hypothetical protein [Candidatus Calescibacterium sp.]MCX7972689.1 hypothetical protein [bacterium]MDW8194714.1 hypothetical protein [Candidatus Calescibacterium sp.]
MSNTYLDKIAEIIENIEKIQQELIVEQKMMKNLISLLNQFSFHQNKDKTIDLEDPVIKKARDVLFKLITSLQEEYYKLDLLEPDEKWKQFHEKFKQSLKTQIEGYKEIFLVFTDGNITHIKVGSLKVEQGLKMIDIEPE